MQVIDALRAAQGGANFDNLARSFGITPHQVEVAIAALIPEVGGTLERNTLSRGGIADVVSALGDPRYCQVLEDPSALQNPAMKSAGVELLEQMIGNKDRSRALAARAAASSGLSETLIKQLLPYVIPMIVGAIAKSSGGALTDILARLPGGGSGLPGTPAPRHRPPAPTASRGPLPLPGEHTPLGGSNPYSDLSDVIRTGGSGAGGLAGLIRSILGGLLGFQSRSVIGWIVRFVIVRWGWTILRSILGGVFGGRR
jgi:hypothetical protein